jgi:Tfp pilus assembly protein PilN
MFVRDPFDLAPGSSRHTRTSWLTLAICVVFALLCAALLERSVETLNRVKESNRAQRLLLDALAQKEAVARAKQSSPAILERIKAQQKLQNMLRLSWSGLFDSLESAGQQVDGRVAILSLAPSRTQAQGAEIGLTAVAVSTGAMIDYISALQRELHIKDVQLTTQQPAQNAGAEGVRFQVSVLWNAEVQATAPQVRGQVDRREQAR